MFFPERGDPPNAVSAPIPEGCNGDFIDQSPEFFTDDCFHMRTSLNALNTPDIDVLIVPPVTPYPERDLRTMRQAVEAWDIGIHELAPKMDMQWLADGVDFDIFVDDDQVRTDPLWDPEIVVVATNPVGGIGIGIDPVDFIFGASGPCHTMPNPVATLGDWLELPGFDSHHDGSGGTYRTDCEGAGPICFAINGAIDPAPGVLDVFGLYDLVAHEVGHCLSVGHVGDAGDHHANAIPTADIMAYTDQSFDKCVSTLDVEVFALVMSRYLLETPMAANDGLTAARGSFHIQHPDDHCYASPTGLAKDCPQPDADLVPGGYPIDLGGQDGDAGSGGDAGDNRGLALPVQAGIDYTGSAGAQDKDWYRIDTAPGQTITVTSGGVAVHQLALVNADDSIIVPAMSLPHQGASAAATDAEATTWSISIAGPAAATPDWYTFRIDIE